MLSDFEKRIVVQRMQDFIEENLQRPITLQQLAKSARYSPWHAARMFKELTGVTSFAYIRMQRLTAAARRLLQEKPPIVDVAFDFVFDSQEGFTRAFSRQFGMPPGKFRKNQPPMPLFMPAQMRDYYVARRKENAMTGQKKSNAIFVQVLERPARKLILKRGTKAKHYFDYCDEVGCDVWEILGGIKDAIHEPMGLWLPKNMCPEGTSSYVQGVELSANYSGDIPQGFEVADLAPCQMMVFQGPPFSDENFDWADEEAPRFQLEPQGYRGYIEGRPVCPRNHAATPE